MSILAACAAKLPCYLNPDLLSSPPMQHASEISVRPCEAKTATLVIDRIELRTIRLPLNEPFETSFGSIDSRLIFLVSVSAEGETGWGEVGAA